MPNNRFERDAAKKRGAPQGASRSEISIHARINCTRQAAGGPTLTNEPLGVRLYIHPVGDHWAAMIVGDAVPPPDPGTDTELRFLGATPEDAEQEAKAYLGFSEPAN